MKKDQIKIKWKVDDFSLHEIIITEKILKETDGISRNEWDKMSQSDKHSFINEIVKCDFEGKIGYNFEWEVI